MEGIFSGRKFTDPQNFLKVSDDAELPQYQKFSLILAISAETIS